MQEQYSYNDNNQTHDIKQPEAMHVQGMSNIFFIKKTQISAEIFGNKNRFELRQSKGQFIINGNYNTIFGVNSDVSIGFTGNHNTVVVDIDSNTHLNFDQGNYNCYPNDQIQKLRKRKNSNSSEEQNIKPSKRFMKLN